MIHYFNPGHETAVLNNSPYYRPPAQQIKMQQDLSFLPAWYAESDDYIWTDTPLTFDFIKSISGFSNISHNTLSVNELHAKKQVLQHETIDFWGLSPASIHYFNNLNQQFDFQWNISQWKNIYRELSSRWSSHSVLKELIAAIPDIDASLLPVRCEDLQSIEQKILQSVENQLLKSPHSSSGRGLLWLQQKPLARSERQIIQGMLKKQSAVSLERALNKCIDFSMQFEINELATKFIGYSLFLTDTKGRYKGSVITDQNDIQETLFKYIDKQLIFSVKQKLTELLHRQYSLHYQGILGVDMMIYSADRQYRMHPCVEINMRKTMGYLAIMLYNKLYNKQLHKNNKAFLQIDYFTDPHRVWQQHQNLLHTDGHYLPLCPINNDSRYHAYIGTMTTSNL